MFAEVKHPKTTGKWEPFTNMGGGGSSRELSGEAVLKGLLDTLSTDI